MLKIAKKEHLSKIRWQFLFATGHFPPPQKKKPIPHHSEFSLKNYSERSKAEGRAERGIGFVKKKMNKKKGTTTTTTTTTTTNFVPGQTFYLFFSNFHTYVPSFHSKKYLWSLLRTNSLQKTSWRNLLWEKKFFLKKNSKIFFEKKTKIFFSKKKFEFFFFFSKKYFWIVFFFSKRCFLTLI